MYDKIREEKGGGKFVLVVGVAFDVLLALFVRFWKCKGTMGNRASNIPIKKSFWR